jgi:RNA recognition motif-containing protein
MSLFVGNISRNLRVEDLEEEFDKIGPCTVNFKVLISTKTTTTLTSSHTTTSLPTAND